MELSKKIFQQVNTGFPDQFQKSEDAKGDRVTHTDSSECKNKYGNSRMEPENEQVFKVIKKAEYVQRIRSRSGKEITAEKSSLYKLLPICGRKAMKFTKLYVD